MISDKHGGAQSREFIYYPYSFEPFALIDIDKQIYYFNNDAVGLPQKLVTPDGEVKWSAKYDAYDKVVKYYTKDIQPDPFLRPV